MQVQCKSCGTAIPAEDVNLDRVLARCRSCNAVFDISDHVESGSARREREEVPLPRRIQVEEMGRALVITRRWWSKVGGFMLFFTVFWNATVSVFIVVFATTDQDLPAFAPWFLLPFVLVGLTTLYLAASFLMNRTTVRVEQGELSVRHWPLPWFGNRTLRTENVEQLYCAEYVGYERNHAPQYQFSVNVVTRGGGKTQLFKGMDEVDQALYIEQRLERHLGIEDRAVRDEYRP